MTPTITTPEPIILRNDSTLASETDKLGNCPQRLENRQLLESVVSYVIFFFPRNAITSGAGSRLAGRVVLPAALKTPFIALPVISMSPT